MTRAPILPILSLTLAALGLGSALDARPVRFLPMNAVVAERDIAIKDEKGTTKLEGMSHLKRSKVYELGNSLELIEFDRANSVEPVATGIALASEIESPLVLILQDPADAAALVCIAIEDGSSHFPWGGIRFVNTTGKPLMIRWEKEVTGLPGSTTPVDLTPGGDARNMGVQVYREEEPGAVLYSAVWQHDPKVRKLAIVTTGADKEGKTIELKVFPEQRTED